jgi:hypothetical protein
MYEMFQDLRWAHITAGSIALLLFWIPVAAPKGGRVHVRIGWAYAALMSVVVATALTMSGLAIATPLSIRHFSHVLSTEETARFIAASRDAGIFLAYLGGVTLAAGWQGIGVLRTRNNPKAFRNWFSVGLNVAVMLAALFVLWRGISQGNGVFLGMSPVGLFVSGGNLRYLLRGPQSKMSWWYDHLGAMIGTGIAGYTAFIVFGGVRIFPALAHTRFYLLFWVMPTLIGVPAIFLTVAYYRRKFHEDGGVKKPSNPQVKAAF